MPPATSTTLQFEQFSATFGTLTTTIDLMASASNGIQLVDNGFAPVIPRVQRAPLGPLGAYVPVTTESITVNIYGATAADCYANLRALAVLLQDAAQWQDEPLLSQARIELVLQPQGSTHTAPLRAVLVDAADVPELPATWHDLTGAYIIENVTIHYTRRVLLADDTEADHLNAIAATKAGSLMHAVWTSSATYTTFAPTSLSMQCTAASGVRTGMPPGYLIVSADGDWPAPITITAGAAFTKGGSWSTPTDATNLPTTSTILRYTSSGFVSETAASVNVVNREARTYAAFVKVRAGDATTVWTLQLVGVKANSVIVRLGDIQTITGSTNARILACGLITTTPAFAGLSIEVAANATSKTLDIESVVLVDMDNPTSTILALPEQVLDSNMLTQPLYTNRWWRSTGAAVLQDIGSYTSQPESYGRADISMHGVGMYAVWYATDAAASTKWNPATSTNVIMNASLSATVMPAYLTPE